MKKWFLNKKKSKDTDTLSQGKIEKTFNFQSLTPTSNADPKGIYSDALNDALMDTNHYNIALTGGYGTGKSSIIETYILKNKLYDNNEILRISLSNFNQEKKQEAKEGNQSKKRRWTSVFGRSTTEQDDKISLELSLLQQFILQITEVKVKNLFLKKFQPLYNKKDIFRFIALVFTVIITQFIFWDSHFLHRFLPTIDIKFLKSIWIRLPSFILMLSSAIYFSYVLVHAALDFKIKGLKLHKFAVEFDGKKDISMLNSYIEEIVYLFKESNFKLVIIEDLDRFEDLEIFEKLREVNNLLKNSHDLKALNKRIQFLYVVRESIFKNENDKNKFFDIIIPVLPFINVKNSRDKLISLFTSEINKYPTKKQSFIDLLKVSSQCIEEMRTVKNIYNDYIIYKKLQIQNKDGEVTIDCVSLLAIVIYKNIIPIDFENINNGKSILDMVFLKRETFEDILTAELNESINLNKESLETSEEVNNMNKRKYEKNKTLLLDVPNYNLSQLLQEIESTEKISKEFEEIFNNYSSKVTEINKRNLIFNLLKDGYINRDFKLYTSTFQPGSITYSDRNIYWDIKNGKKIGFERRIDNPKALLEYFDKPMWKRLNYLNEALFDEILFSDDYFDNLILILKQDDNYLLEFLNFYIPKTTNLKRLAHHIFEFSANFSERAINAKEIKDDIFDKLLEYLIHENKFCWSNQNKDYVLTNYLRKKDNITLVFQNFRTNKVKIQSFLEHLLVKFYRLSSENEKELLDLVYKNSRYELNIHMIKLWGEVYSQEELKYPSYSNVKKSALNELEEYVDSNLVDFLMDVLLKLKEEFGTWEENEKSLIELLNTDGTIENKNIDKVGVINGVDFYEFNLKDYNESLWETIVANKKLKCTWLNLSLYFEKFGIDDYLIDSLDNKEWIESLDFFSNESKEKIGHVKALNYIEALLELEVNKNSLEHIIKKYKYLIPSNILSGVTTKSNIKLLITLKALSKKEPVDVYDQLKSHFRDDLLHMEFALEYASEILNHEDTSKVFNSLNKQELLFIVRNNFPKECFEIAFSQINDPESLVLDSFEALDILEQIKKQSFTNNKDFLAKLLKDLPSKEQPSFFVWIYRKIEINKFESNNYLVRFKGNLKNLNQTKLKFRIPQNESNLEFVEVLKQMGLIKDYNIEKANEVSFYRNHFRNFNS